MSTIFRKEALRHGAQRLDGSVILASTMPARIFAGVLALSFFTAIYVISNIELFDTRLFDGRVSTATDSIGFPLVELWVPAETAIRLKPGIPATLTFKLWDGVSMQASGRLHRKTGTATELPKQHHPVAGPGKYNTVFVRIDSRSQRELYRSGRIALQGDVIGELEINRSSIFHHLVNRID